MEARPDKEFVGSAWLQRFDESGAARGTKTWQAASGHQGTWPCVALNVDFHMRFESIEAGLELEWQGRGPELPGQNATANVAVATPCIVRGRFVGPANEGQTNSIAPRFFYTFICLNDQREVLNEVRFFTDEKGDFEVALPRLLDPLSAIDAEIVGMWTTNQVNERIRVRLPQKGWGLPGTIDLGEIHAQIVPHSIVGHLADTQGNPLASVTVIAQPDRAGQHVSTTSQADGRFALNGLWADRVPLIVPAGQDWYLPEDTTWESRFDPITLTLHPTGSITGSITGQIPDANGSATVECKSESDIDPFETQVSVEGNGKFRIHGLAPGLYRLRLTGHDATKRIQVYEGQVSRAGALQ